MCATSRIQRISATMRIRTYSDYCDRIYIAHIYLLIILEAFGTRFFSSLLDAKFVVRLVMADTPSLRRMIAFLEPSNYKGA